MSLRLKLACGVLIICAQFFIASSIHAAGKIGDACTSNSQCTTGLCEDSFCTCTGENSEGSSQCQAQYGGTAQGWSCLDDSKDKSKNHGDWLNFCVKNEYIQTNGYSFPENSTDAVKFPQERKAYMGEPCYYSSACLSGNNTGASDVCNETAIDSTAQNDPWYAPGKKLNVCECLSQTTAFYNPSMICAAQYGAGDYTCVDGTFPGADGTNVCRRSNGQVPQSLEDMKKFLPSADSSGSSNDAFVTGQGTIFGFDVQTEYNPVQPNPRIDVPGVIFSKITKESNITTDEFGASWLNIPFLGEYIAAIYRYSVILVSIIAVIVLIASGAQIVTSAGNSEAISGAKHRITSAVIAIILVAGSYTILYTVNPELVNLKNLKILVVPQKDLNIPDGEGGANLNLDTPQGDATITAASNVPGAAPVSGDKYVCGNTGSIEEKRENCKQWCISNTDKSAWPEYTRGTLLKTELQKRLDTPGIKLNLKRDSGIPNKLVESLKLVGLAARNHPEGPFTVQINDSYRPLSRAIEYVCDKFTEVQKLKDEGKSVEADKLWKTLGPVLSFPGANAHNIATGGAVDVLLLDNSGDPLVNGYNWFQYYTQDDPSKAKAVRIIAEIFYSVPGWQRYMWEVWHFDYNSTAALRTNTCTKPIAENSRICPQ